MKCTLILISLLAVAMVPAFGDTRCWQEEPLLGYTDVLKPDSDEARAARHAKVAERRKGPAVLVHRGAFAFAPENTLEAYAAAMDYGADGNEIDIRRTADGVLVMLHDDYLERLTNGFGPMNHLTYYELLSLGMRQRYGTADRRTNVPTLVAVLELLRRRAALIHLDVKEPGLEDAIGALLDQADMWDHVVSINTANAARLRARAEAKQLQYKASGLYNFGRDLDPAATREDLDKAGQQILVDDPRVAAMVLGRPAYEPVALPADLRKWWQPNWAPGSSDRPMQSVYNICSAINPDNTSDLVNILNDADDAERFNADGDAGRQQYRTRRLVERAWAARRLGQLGRPYPEVIRALERQVTGRTLHRDWMYHGLDAATAVEALAELGSVSSVPLLIQWHDSQHSELANIADASFPGNPVEWLDWRTRELVVEALGDLRTPESTTWLLAYVRKSAADIRPLHPGRFDLAGASLVLQRPSAGTLTEAVRSPSGVAKANALLRLLDSRIPSGDQVLRETNAWALELPRAPGQDRYR
ncbi:MAG: glycerophosphodiester phosphodiesterase family protein [Bryobacteraceae bacterium]|nr:glycerophosphodiester phosphodiesterase family protein [Bryobacteraceae bacterium]